MQQNNQNHSNINPNAKPLPLASEQATYIVEVSIEMDDCVAFSDWLKTQGHQVSIIDSECSFINGTPTFYDRELMVTVLMCEQVIAATKMGYVNPNGGYGLGYDFIAREFMKDDTAMNKESFAPIFKEVHGRLMQQIVNDGRWGEFNYLMGGAPHTQESLF